MTTPRIVQSLSTTRTSFPSPALEEQANPSLLNLPTTLARPPVLTQEIAAAPFHLSQTLLQQLEQLAAGIPFSTTLSAAFQLLLYRYTHQKALTLGLRLLNQDGCAWQQIHLTLTDGQPSWQDWLAQVHQAFQTEATLSPAPASPAQVAFLWQREAALPTHKQQIGAGDDLELALCFTEHDDQLAAAFLYSADLFDPAAVQRMIGHFQTLLHAIVAHPLQTVDTLPLLTPAERQQLLVEWNATELPDVQDTCVPAWVEQQAAQQPEAPAVVFGEAMLTYGQLNARANQLAHHLQKIGVGVDVVVGVCVERSLEMIVGWLAVLKAGGAYLSLDPQSPPERLAFLFQDSQMLLLLTQEKWVAHLPATAPQMICLDRDWPVIAAESCTNPDKTITPAQLAYVIYTSGSTGTPKGVMIPHLGLRNLVAWHQHAFGLTAADCATQLANLAFDASVWETWPYLTIGATLYLTPPEILLAPTTLRDWLLHHNITITFVPTPLAEQLLALPWPPECALRHLLTGGDKLNQAPRQPLPFHLVNNYGPTEASVVATSLVVPPDGRPAPPIGRPIANTQVYLLDPHGEPVPIGVPGELYLGGRGLARGYLHQPTLTAERFVTMHFPLPAEPPDPQNQGQRLYKTGDLARYLPDGNIEFLGRLDHQVKIRGFRIELGEVEAAIRQQPHIQEALVLAHEERPGQKYLAAYLVPADGALLHPEEIEHSLATRLPAYMTPTAWAILPALPLTPNGKVDRNALPTPHPSRQPGPQTGPQTGLEPGLEPGLEQQIASAWRAVLQLAAVGLDDNFFDVGGTSLLLAQLHTYLVEHLGMTLSPVLFYQYPTIRTLAAHLRQATTTTAEPQLPQPHNFSQDAIAIIGMSCRFPGANDVATFWQNLCAGAETLTFLADEDLFAPEASFLQQPNYVKAAALVAEIDQFDAEFFGYSAKEAAMMDPQQRLFLECAWEALEEAGYAPSSYPGRVGVYAGSGPNTYLFNNVSPAHHFAHQRSFWEPMQELALTLAQEKDFLPTRVSYKLNLRGPSINVQTACSTSLVAVHLACQALRNGECEMALAGAASIMVPQNIGYLYQEGLVFAPDGHCRPFDAKAQGTVFGSGVGAVLLKPLTQALADHDPIYAVIKGSAVNNDGAAKVGYTAPGVQGQATVIAAALAAANIPAESVTYLEAHGTGTALGDPVEIQALTQAFRQTTTQNAFCAVGTVKSNVGHLMMAAGMPGLIKTALALRHALLPPTLHFEQPNPRIDFAHTPFYVNKNLTPWPRRKGAETLPRRAGISSFGMGGTNAHLVLEEAPQPVVPTTVTTLLPQWRLCTLSAKSHAALHALAQRYHTYLQNQPNTNLADLCFTTQVGRTHFSHRLALTTQSLVSLTEQLAAAQPTMREDNSTDLPNTPTVAFLFTGQGSQSVNMGRQLYEIYPIFRQTLDRCDETLRPHLGISLLEILYPPTGDTHKIDETLYTQPALFALEYALAQLWLKWGIEPTVVMGHSVGEYVAACVAGVFSLEDGLKLIAARGRLMQSLPQKGGMAAVFAAEAKVAPLLAADQLAIAAVNGPEHVVISGDQNALDAVRARLTALGIKSVALTVSHAFHSPLMQPILAEFAQVAQTVTFSAPQRKLISNVTGELIGAEIATPDYWCQHILAPVRFADGLAALDRQTITALIEIGPKPVLLGMARTCLPDHKKLWLPSLDPDQPDEAQLLQSVGALYSAGATIDWQHFAHSTTDFPARRRLSLPTYPFQRQRHWIDAPTVRSDRRPEKTSNRADHPLLGHPIPLAGSTEIRFEGQLDPQWPHLSWLQDHCVGETLLMPLTGYLEMAWAAGTQLYPAADFAVADLLIHQPLALTAGQTTTLQFVLQPSGEGAYQFQIFARTEAAHPPQPAPWQRTVSGQLLQHAASETLPPDLPCQPHNGSTSLSVDQTALRARCSQSIDPTAFYRAYHMNYGPTFQSIQTLWQGEDEVFAQIQTPPSLLTYLEDYYLHPAVLDACGHILGTLMPSAKYLPMWVERWQIYQPPTSELWSYARRRPYSPAVSDTETAAAPAMIVGDVYLFNAAGQLVASMVGTTVKQADTAAPAFAAAAQLPTPEWFYQIGWERTAPLLPEPPHLFNRWLIFSDHTGVGTRLAEQLTRLGQEVITVQKAATYTAGANRHVTLDPQQPAHFAQLLHALQPTDETSSSPIGIVYMWPMDESTEQTSPLDALPQTTLAASTSVLHLVQALAAGNQPCKLWLITQGAQPVVDSALQTPTLLNLQQSALWGMGRGIDLEHPEFGCTLLDLDPAVTPATAVCQMRQELITSSPERQIAYRQGMRYVARLHPSAAAPSPKQPLPSTEPFRVQMAEYGLLENLQFVPLHRRPPAPDEVEIQVRAVGLNFRDLLNVLGMLADYYAQSLGITDAREVLLGFECAGTVVAVGAEVTGIAVGDAVMALADGSLASHVTVTARHVLPKPETLSFEEAATLPVAFLTAWYGLQQLAALKAGDRVLIHAAAGGVGQAALQLAQQAGAEIFGTASPSKWAQLQALGVTHLFHSRTMDFADEIMALTHGQGVDLILNSLSGDFIAKNFAVLAQQGRMVELGKLGIWDARRVQQTRPDVAYFQFDFREDTLADPTLTPTLLAKIGAGLADGTLTALPHTVFPLTEIAAALRLMQQAGYVGKIVLAVPPSPHTPTVAPRRPPAIHAEGSYWITGGLGGLGLQVAQWLAKQGARHLVLSSRRGIAPPSAQPILDQLAGQGVEVLTVAADVAQAADVQRVLACCPQPLRGVVHAAGVLADGLLPQQSAATFAQVMAPKVAGSWYLHQFLQQTPTVALDFFVAFSSIASTLGAPGQSNYAAANAFLDALMYQRHAQGLPALVINWGPWADVGMAAELSTRDRQRLQQQGMRFLPPATAIATFAQLLQQSVPQTSVITFDWSHWLTQPATLTPFYQRIRQAVADQAHNHPAQKFATNQPHNPHQEERNGSTPTRHPPTAFRERLAQTQPGQQRPLLLAHVQEQVTKVLGRGPNGHLLGLQTGFFAAGMDSLTSIELRNYLQASLECSLSATVVFNYSTIERLTDYLATTVLKLTLPADPTATQPAPSDPFAKTIEQLSDDEAESALLAELEKMAI